MAIVVQSANHFRSWLFLGAMAAAVLLVPAASADTSIYQRDGGTRAWCDYKLAETTTNGRKKLELTLNIRVRKNGAAGVGKAQCVFVGRNANGDPVIQRSLSKTVGAVALAGTNEKTEKLVELFNAGWYDGHVVGEALAINTQDSDFEDVIKNEVDKLVRSVDLKKVKLGDLIRIGKFALKVFR